MKRLFLDDRDIRVERFPHRKDSHVVRSAFQAIQALATQRWDEVWLDHDLNDQRHDEYPERVNHGLTVALFIAAARPVIDRVIIHSTNDKAAHEMLVVIRAAGYNVTLRRAEWDK